jgi:hypothetical protein
MKPPRGTELKIISRFFPNVTGFGSTKDFQPINLLTIRKFEMEYMNAQMLAQPVAGISFERF